MLVVTIVLKKNFTDKPEYLKSLKNFSLVSGAQR